MNLRKVDLQKVNNNIKPASHICQNGEEKPFPKNVCAICIVESTAAKHASDRVKKQIVTIIDEIVKNAESKKKK